MTQNSRSELAPPDRPVFLERRSYRRRRLVDAARFLPVVIAFLWLVPLFWSKTPEQAQSGSSSEIYVFAVWCGAIFGAFCLSRLLMMNDHANRDANSKSLQEPPQ